MFIKCLYVNLYLYPGLILSLGKYSLLKFTLKRVNFPRYLYLLTFRKKNSVCSAKKFAPFRRKKYTGSPCSAGHILHN